MLALIFARPAKAVEFVISDPVVSGLELTLSASISASSNYYLQGLLRSQSSSKYFGETQNNRGDWVDYLSSPEKEYIVSNFYLTDIKDATWSGQLKLRFKLDDQSYLGPGPYDLKLRRYTGNSTSSAGESNTLVINLTVPLPTPSPTPTPTPTPTPSPSPSPSPSPTQTSTPTPKPPAPSVVLKDELGSVPPAGTVAGESIEIDLSGFGTSPVPSGEPTLQGQSLPAQAGSQGPTLNKSRAKTALLVGSGLLILSVSGYFGYRKYLVIKGPDLEGWAQPRRGGGCQTLRYTQYMKKYLVWIFPLGWAILIWRLTTTSQIIVTEEYLLQNILMMGAHFTFFGVQSILIYLSLPQFFVFSSNVAVVLTSLYGAIVEFRQFSVPGRSADPMDWILDTLGAITFIFILKRLSKLN